MERFKRGGRNAHRHRMLCLVCFNSYLKQWRKYKKGKGDKPDQFYGRYTLPRHPNKYVNKKKINCPVCSSDHVKSVEAYRQKEMDNQDTCNCQPIPFPHNKKNPPLGCDHHRKDYDDWTDEDHMQYEEMIRTPRSG